MTAMLENGHPQIDQQREVIALPPLKMALFHAVDERLTRVALLESARKLSSLPVLGNEGLEKQSLEKIIEHIERIEKK